MHVEYELVHILWDVADHQGIVGGQLGMREKLASVDSLRIHGSVKQFHEVFRSLPQILRLEQPQIFVQEDIVEAQRSHCLHGTKRLAGRWHATSTTHRRTSAVGGTTRGAGSFAWVNGSRRYRGPH